MTYHIVFSPTAYEKLDRYVEYIAEQEKTPLTASRWLTKALAAVRTLKSFPHRCPPAPENELSKHTVRMLIVDRCLFLYRVDEPAKTVRVLSFRHSAKQPQPLEDDEL